jgi:hypothetical protein
MEATRTSETLVNFYQTTRCYNPEDSNLHTHRRENLKSYSDSSIYETKRISFLKVHAYEKIRQYLARGNLIFNLFISLLFYLTAQCTNPMRNDRNYHLRKGQAVISFSFSNA